MVGMGDVRVRVPMELFDPRPAKAVGNDRLTVSEQEQAMEECR